MEEIFWEKLPCVVVKLWFKFREISSSFDQVSDFSIFPPEADFSTCGNSRVVQNFPKLSPEIPELSPEIPEL